MKYPYSFFLLITTALISPSLLLAGEVNLTTYYPAPSGNYDTLTVNTALTAFSASLTNTSIGTANITTVSNKPQFSTGLTVGGVDFIPDPNVGAGASFSQGGQNLFFVGSGNNGIAIPNGKNLIIEGTSNGLIIGGTRTSRTNYPLDLSNNTTSGIKILLSRSPFAGIGVSNTDGLTFNTSDGQVMSLNNSLLKTINIHASEDITSSGVIASSREIQLTNDNDSMISLDNNGNINAYGNMINSRSGAGVKNGTIKLATSQPANLENGMMWLE